MCLVYRKQTWGKVIILSQQPNKEKEKAYSYFTTITTDHNYQKTHFRAERVSALEKYCGLNVEGKSDLIEKYCVLALEK